MAHKTVLIVEDDADLRDALTTALENESYTVITAHDGIEGYKVALKEHPDVILLDILMPNMNGHEALERIRNDPWGKDAKVIFLTSFSDAENVVYAVDKGSEKYIVKSQVSLKEIITKVKQTIHGY